VYIYIYSVWRLTKKFLWAGRARQAD